MDLHPEQLPSFFDIMSREGADLVLGSKWHSKSRITYPLHRRVFSIGYYTLVKCLFGLPTRDTQTGMKLCRTRVLRDVLANVRERRFAFDLEMLVLAHHRGYVIREAPVTLDFRRTLGRVRLRDVWAMFIDTLRIFWQLRVRRAYDEPDPSAEPAEAPKIS